MGLGNIFGGGGQSDSTIGRSSAGNGVDMRKQLDNILNGGSDDVVKRTRNGLRNRIETGNGREESGNPLNAGLNYVKNGLQNFNDNFHNGVEAGIEMKHNIVSGIFGDKFDGVFEMKHNINDRLHDAIEAHIGKNIGENPAGGLSKAGTNGPRLGDTGGGSVVTTEPPSGDGNADDGNDDDYDVEDEDPELDDNDDSVGKKNPKGI